MKKGASCSSCSECRSGRKERRTHGSRQSIRQDAAQAEIQGPRAQPLPHLRPAARLHPQVPDVPHLFPRARPARRSPRRAQGELVEMQTDPISDMLTRIRNAARARHARVELPASKLKIEIARVLKEEGFISTYKVVDESKTRKALRLFLKYTPDKSSVISDLRRVSRPGSRRYVGTEKIKAVF